jgi:hypothetical protein
MFAKAPFAPQVQIFTGVGGKLIKVIPPLSEAFVLNGTGAPDIPKLMEEGPAASCLAGAGSAIFNSPFIDSISSR